MPGSGGPPIWTSPPYANDERTAITVVDGSVEVVSEGQWTRFDAWPRRRTGATIEDTETVSGRGRQPCPSSPSTSSCPTRRPRPSGSSAPATIKATAQGTGGALSVVEFTHPPGFVVPRHVHHEADEAFYILAGGATGTCGDQSWRATPGSFIWLPRGTPHEYAVDSEETLRTLAINLPAGFEQFVAEAGEPARERTLPPPGEPDLDRLDAAAAKVGIEHLPPPP